MQPLVEESLYSRTTLALEATATAFISTSCDEEVIDALAWAERQGLPVVPLGQGSNLVPVGPVEALVLHQADSGIRLLRDDGEQAVLRVRGGHDWHALVGWCLARELHGLENLALIPGTVGAAPIQNIGAYGVELSSCLTAVHGYYLANGEAFTLDREACELSYRDSVFKRRLRDRVIITEVDLRLSRDWRPVLDYPALAAVVNGAGRATPGDVFTAVVEIRQGKLPDPEREPNAGSFFKNPVITEAALERLLGRFPDLPHFTQPGGGFKLPAAWLIEHCGWKGHRRDGVGVHPGHALVLVNYGSNSGSALLQLARDIAASVEEVFGVSLELEPKVLGTAR
jgi:UDP-N-acetylmuramate dehydrogenase